MTTSETPAPALVRIERIRQAATVLDAAIPIPGTKYSFGIDAVIGLVPGLGDAVGVVFASMILYQAFRLGASKRLLTRMLYNVGVDGILGAIPLLGDWHDVVWKANVKNVDLLERQLQHPDKTARASGWFLLIVLGAVVGMGVAAIVIAVWAIRWLLGLF
jgi:hypothetical protein